jgi:adenine deaminase
MFIIPTKPTGSSSPLLQVIGITPGQIIIKKKIVKPKICENYQAIADAQRDIAKFAVIERHHRTRNFGVLVQDLGIKRGAIATSVVSTHIIFL